MTFHTTSAPHLFQELVDERIRGLQREAAEHRLASRVASANKARETSSPRHRRPPGSPVEALTATCRKRPGCTTTHPGLSAADLRSLTMTEPEDLTITRAAYDAVAARYAEDIPERYRSTPLSHAMIPLFAETMRARGPWSSPSSTAFWPPAAICCSASRPTTTPPNWPSSFDHAVTPAHRYSPGRIAAPAPRRGAHRGRATGHRPQRGREAQLPQAFVLARRPAN